MCLLGGSKFGAFPEEVRNVIFAWYPESTLTHVLCSHTVFWADKDIIHLEKSMFFFFLFPFFVHNYQFCGFCFFFLETKFPSDLLHVLIISLDQFKETGYYKK